MVRSVTMPVIMLCICYYESVWFTALISGLFKYSSFQAVVGLQKVNLGKTQLTGVQLSSLSLARPCLFAPFMSTILLLQNPF